MALSASPSPPGRRPRPAAPPPPPPPPSSPPPVVRPPERRYSVPRPAINFMGAAAMVWRRAGRRRQPPSPLSLPIPSSSQFWRRTPFPPCPLPRSPSPSLWIPLPSTPFEDRVNGAWATVLPCTLLPCGRVYVRVRMGLRFAKKGPSLNPGRAGGSCSEVPWTCAAVSTWPPAGYPDAPSFFPPSLLLSSFPSPFLLPSSLTPVLLFSFLLKLTAICFTAQ